MLLLTTGRATLAEVEPTNEATLGANMRAAIANYEYMRRDVEEKLRKSGEEYKERKRGVCDKSECDCWKLENFKRKDGREKFFSLRERTHFAWFVRPAKV